MISDKVFNCSLGVFAILVISIFAIQEMTVRRLHEHVDALEQQMWVNATEYAKNYVLNCK